MFDFLKESMIGKILAFLVVSYALLFLGALWFNQLDDSFFLKLTITYFVVGGVLVAVYLIRREFVSDKAMRDDKFMD